MNNDIPLINSLRTRRKLAGLSQRDLATILGYSDEGAVSRHELFSSIPPLLMALGYEVVFQSSISELFPGLRQTIEIAIEKSLVNFEITLRKQHDQLSSEERTGILRKLEWLKARREKGN